MPVIRTHAPQADSLRILEQMLARQAGISPTGIAFENQLDMSINKEKLLLYGVSYDELYRILKTAF